MISTRTIDATVVNGGTADASIINGNGIGTVAAIVAAVPIYTCESDIRLLTIVQIKEQLRARGLRLGGNKALLKERLIGAIVHCNAIAGGELGSSTIEINDRATN